jgi:hypothetical protein
MFFNDALENNLGRYPDLLKVEMGRMLRWHHKKSFTKHLVQMLVYLSIYQQKE